MQCKARAVSNLPMITGLLEIGSHSLGRAQHCPFDPLPPPPPGPSPSPFPDPSLSPLTVLLLPPLVSSPVPLPSVDKITQVLFSSQALSNSLALFPVFVLCLPWPETTSWRAWPVGRRMEAEVSSGGQIMSSCPSKCSLFSRQSLL